MPVGKAKRAVKKVVRNLRKKPTLKRMKPRKPIRRNKPVGSGRFTIMPVVPKSRFVKKQFV